MTTTFQTDSRRRTTLPAVFPADGTFEVELLPDGTFRVIPLAMIPVHQLWAWRPEVQEAVARASGEKGVALESRKGQAFLKTLEK